MFRFLRNFLYHNFQVSRSSVAPMGSSLSLQSAMEITSNWHKKPEEGLIFDCGSSEISRYLQALDKIHEQLADGNQLCGIIVPLAIARLKHEFHSLLTDNTRKESSDRSNQPGTDDFSGLSRQTESTSCESVYEDYVVYEAPTPSKEVIDYLQSISERMDRFGYLHPIIQAYETYRKDLVDAMFKRLKLEELDKRYMRFAGQELMMKTKRWIQGAKFCIILFEKEKQLANQIFSGLRTSAIDEWLLHTVEDAASNLFAFPMAVSLSHQSSERLEVILILYEELLSIKQAVNALFSSRSAEYMGKTMAEILSKLQDEIGRMLSDFENGVFNELSTVSDDGGTVHRLTKYVIEYIDLLVKYEKVLKFVVSKPTMTVGAQKFPDEELQDRESLSPLALHLILIIDVLQFNLENKSIHYKDTSLQYLFMMNNNQYIVQKIKESKELQQMIGADYCKKLTRNVKQAMSIYEALTCERFLFCFREEGIYVSQCFSYGVSKSALRKRMKEFNQVFEATLKCQSSWEIADLSLQEELRQSMLEKLLPAYKFFLFKFRFHLDSRKHRKTCIQHFQKISIKYSLEELEALVKRNL